MKPRWNILSAEVALAVSHFVVTTAFLRFIVNADGSVSDAEVVEEDAMRLRSTLLRRHGLSQVFSVEGLFGYESPFPSRLG